MSEPNRAKHDHALVNNLVRGVRRWRRYVIEDKLMHDWGDPLSAEEFLARLDLALAQVRSTLVRDLEKAVDV